MKLKRKKIVEGKKTREAQNERKRKRDQDSVMILIISFLNQIIKHYRDGSFSGRAVEGNEIQNQVPIFELS